MIRTVEDAWRWYQAVKTLALDIKRLSGTWNDPAWDTVRDRDNRLRNRTAADLVGTANTVLEDLDDLAVLVLFSVFEATVRDLAKRDVERATAMLRHPAVMRAVNDLKEAIENGSFGRVTEAYKQWTLI